MLYKNYRHLGTNELIHISPNTLHQNIMMSTMSNEINNQIFGDIKKIFDGTTGEEVTDFRDNLVEYSKINSKGIAKESYVASQKFVKFEEIKNSQESMLSMVHRLWIR